MKIYDTYRTLFESYTKLISEELLDEVQWESNKESKLRRGEVPLTSSIVKKMFEEPRVVEAFHVTDIDKVFEITKIVGKRNSISAFKYFSDYNIMNAQGIQTKGGVVLKIRGVMDIMGSEDIMSTVDRSVNRRWISSKMLSKNLYDDLLDYFDTFKFNQNPSEVREYMTYIFKLFDKYHDEIQDNLIRMIFSSSYNGGWNELLVKNVKVMELAWLPEKSIKFYVADEEKEKLIQDSIEKLKTLTPNVYTFYDGKDMLEWFRGNGGHIELDDFRKSEFSNYKKEDLMKSMGGLIALAKFNFDYFKYNFDKFKHLFVKEKNGNGEAYNDIIRSVSKYDDKIQIIKMIFMANGKDWDDDYNIDNLIKHTYVGSYSKSTDSNSEFCIWLLNFFGDRLTPEIFKYIIKNVNPSQEFVNAVLSIYGNNMDVIENMVKTNITILKYVDVLDEEILIDIVEKDYHALSFIKNPSEKLQLIAIKENYSAMQFIENPSEAVKIAAIKINPCAIKYIKDSTPQLQIMAMSISKQKVTTFHCIQNPSEKVKMAAVMANGLIIQYIISPSEELQMAAVKQNDTAYFYIKNPTDNVKRFVGTIDENHKKNIRNILRG